jgi:hypothetical protein
MLRRVRSQPHQPTAGAGDEEVASMYRLLRDMVEGGEHPVGNDGIGHVHRLQ